MLQHRSALFCCIISRLQPVNIKSIVYNMSTYKYNFITPQQSRMARAALGLTVRDVAEITGLAAMTITRFENGSSRGSPESLQAIADAYQDRGIVFIPKDEELGPGVRLANVSAL